MFFLDSEDIRIGRNVESPLLTPKNNISIEGGKQVQHWSIPP